MHQVDYLRSIVCSSILDDIGQFLKSGEQIRLKFLCLVLKGAKDHDSWHPLVCPVIPCLALRDFGANDLRRPKQDIHALVGIELSKEPEPPECVLMTR